MESLGKGMVLCGIGLALLGGLIWLGSRLPWLHLGRLPGDIAIERPTFSFYIPITTMLLVSALLTFLMWLWSLIRK